MIREMQELPTDLGRELRAVYDRGDLVSDELMIRLIRDRLSRGDTLAGFVLDGFPRTMPQAEALDELLRELGRDLDVVFDFQVPDREVLHASGCSAAPRRRAAPTTRPRRSSGGSSSTTRETAPLVEYYRSHQANVVGIHADRADRRGLPRDRRRRSTGAGIEGRRVIIRKSAAEIEGMARAGELLARDARARRRASRARRRRCSSSTASPTSTSRRRAGIPTSKGYKGFPAALCISPNSMVVHGIPDAYRAREGDLISVDLGVTLDGLVADSAVTLPVGEISPEAQRLLDVCQEALAAGIEQAQRRATGSPTSRTPSRSSSRRPASRSSGASSATASAARTTRTRRSRTTGRRAAGRCCRRG